MDIAVLSDCRYPSREDYPGHGLGRSIARIAAGLAQRGHAVTLYGAPGSDVPGCTVIADGDEIARAHGLNGGYDVYLDSTHHFELSKIGDLPIVNKVNDFEDHPPRNAVYNTRLWAEKHGEPDGIVIVEGIDVTHYPFYDGEREPYLVWVGANYNVGWKRLDVALNIATWLNRPMRIVGVQGLELPPQFQQEIHTSPAQTYDVLAHAHAVIGWLPTATFLEGAACGTPSLGSYDNAHMIADGVTGYTRHTPEELAVAVQYLGDIKPKRCREWIATERSVEVQVTAYERLLERAANGGKW